MHRAVFLDRDNTLIHNNGDLGDPAEARLIRGAASAIASLRGLNYQIVVITNQGGVARGKFTEEEVVKTNERIAELVAENSGARIDRFYFCPYHPEGEVESYRREHPWRKPQPGMLLQAAKDLNLDLDASWTIGDGLRDIEAGKAAGTRTILLRTEAGELFSDVNDKDEAVEPDFTAGNLIEAVRLIAQHLRREPESAEVAAEPRVRVLRRKTPPSSPSESPPSEESKPAAPKASPDTATPPPPKPPRTNRQPFKPWDIQPADNAPPHRPAPKARTAPPPSSPQPAPAGEPRAEKSVEPAPREPASRPEPASQPAGPGATIETPAPPTQATPSNDETPSLLREILRELKAHRLHDEVFSHGKGFLMAVLQMLAAGCIGVGLLQSSAAPVMTNWLLGAVFCQLAVVALLVLPTRR